MEKEEKAKESKECYQECCKEKMNWKHHGHHNHTNSSAIYCMGVIGALFYFLQNAPTFGAVMIGIGKSIFWPAILMFKLLTYLGM
jgi:hypothetical protein